MLLLGGSDDDNLFQWPEKELLAQLDRLTNAEGNVIQWTFDHPELYDFVDVS